MSVVRRMSRTSVIIAAGTVHGDTIVPHHQIVRSPDMAVDKLALRGVLGEVAQEGAGLRHQPSLRCCLHGSPEERQAAGRRVLAHQGRLSEPAPISRARHR